MNIHTQQSERGITLLITLLFMSVLLGITATLLNVSLKQYKIASIGLASEISFQAAQAGLECAVYHDFNTLGQDFDSIAGNEAYIFQVPGTANGEQSARPRISCMNFDAFADNTLDDDDDGMMKSGEEQLFKFTWGTAPNERCTSVSVYKFRSDTGSVSLQGTSLEGGSFEIKNPDNSVRECPQGGECTIIKSRGYNVACDVRSTAGRVVERELTQIY